MSRSHANRGQAFEDFLRFVHQRYQADGIACVHKVPTEFLPLRNAKGQVCSAKVEHKSCVDYLGRYKGIPVAIEAKHTEENRIAFNRVEPHQAEYLDDWLKDPHAIALVLVSFSIRRFYAVPWEFWKAALESWQQHKGKEKRTVTAYGWTWTTPGMASVSEDQLHPEWEIKTGGRSGLPYLEIINKMTGGERSMQTEDKVVKSFDMSNLLKITRLPLVCVYNSPSDYPGKYVARLWDVDKPTNMVAVAESLEEIREAKPPEMMIMDRMPNDDPVIVETWI